MATLVNYTCKSFIKLTPGCNFCQWKVNIILWSDNKRLKKIMLFLTTWKRYYLVAVHIYSPLGKGCLMSLLLCLYPGVLNGFCLSRKTIPQCVLGVNPRGSKIINVKCLIVANRHPHQCIELGLLNTQIVKHAFLAMTDATYVDSFHSEKTP